MTIACPNKNTKEWKTLEKALGQDRAYLAYFKANKKENKSHSVKQGVNELFDEFPNLNVIGSPKQYSRYIETIFPNSKVKDIVYHGTDKDFQGFIKDKKVTPKGRTKGGIWFTDFANADWVYKEEEGKVIAALINLQNPVTYNTEREFDNVYKEYYTKLPLDKGQWKDIQELLDKKQGDGLLLDIFDATTAGDVGEFTKQQVVFEPEQIHILGSKQDIEGFKEFVSKDKSSKKAEPKNYENLQEKLQNLYPEIKLTITNNPVWEKGDNVFNQEEYENQVKYRLKSVELLTSDKAEQVFSKGKKNGWDLNKILTELQVPKEQKQIILNKDITDREEIITSLLADNSFVVEINTAREKEGLIKDGSEFKVGEDYYYSDPNRNVYTILYSKENGGGSKNISKQEFENARQRSKPTTYYSNLTVPGGTNYTENEISTPDITPNIKGHAQFATDKGIGWFRSDDKAFLDKKYPTRFKDSYGSEWYLEKGIWYNLDQDGVTHKRDDLTDDEVLAIVENKIYDSSFKADKILDGKTRRILEVQSDLFQKGRDYSSLSYSHDLNEFRDGQIVETNKGRFKILESVYYNTPEIDNRYGKRVQNLETGKIGVVKRGQFIKSLKLEDKNQFLQLLNKKNNWVTFFVKSIIQDSAKKGYEKILFPKGDTAAKIEGHQTLEEFRKQKEARIKELNSKLDIINKANEKDYTYIQGIGAFRLNGDSSVKDIIGKGEIKNFDKAKEVEKNNVTNEINTLKQELADVESGKTKLSSIANFYENTITNILKKNGYNSVEITDEHGNKWNEVSITPTVLSEILLQKDEFDRIIGQANIKAGTVLIDAINQKADTLPHEYAHHYIAWFRNAPIVKEAIKKWGSEEALVQSIGEQVVKQKGEALGWWRRFTKWILSQFNHLSNLKKEELTNILTDAFLNRENLNQDSGPRIPSLLEAQRLIQGDQTVEQSIIKELQHAGWISKRQFKSNASRHEGKVLFSIPKNKTVNDIQKYIGKESNATLFKRNKGAINGLMAYNTSWFTLQETKNATFFIVDEAVYNGSKTIDFEKMDDDRDFMNYLQYWHSLDREGKVSENALRVQEGKEELPIDGDPMFQKTSFIGDTETQSVAEKKIERIKSVLKAKGIDVEVRLDTSLEEKGKFIKEEGKNVIVLNPNKLSSDTVTHEFAHLFIDYLGLDNQRVKAALERLRTTSLWDRVAEKYPELEGAELEMEVLATAIGMEAANIWSENKEEQGWWSKFKEWFYAIISKKLGLDNFAVKQLSKELIGATEKQTRVDELTYDSRNFSKEIKDLDDAMAFIIGDLKRRYYALKNIKDVDNAYMQEILDIRKKLNSYYDTYDANLIINYTDQALKQLRGALKRVEETNDYTTLHRVRTYISGYKILSELGRVTKNVELSDESREKLNNAINDANRLFNDIDAKLKIKTRKLAARALAANSAIGYATLREEFEKEANVKFPGQKGAKEEYVNKKMTENEDRAQQIALDYYERILEFTPSDITTASAWVNDPASTGSDTISMVTKMLDNADARTRAHFLKERNRLHTLVKEYQKKTGKKDYKHLIVTDSEGTKYLRNGWNPEFLRLYNKMQSDMFTAKKEWHSVMQKNGNKHKDTIAAKEVYEAEKKKFEKWVADNTTGKYIKDKWKDNAVLTADDKKLLEEFNKSFRDSDFKLPEDKKLSKHIYNETFVKLPSITKTKWEAESLSEAAKQSWEKAIHIQADEEELGQIPDDISSFRRMGAKIVETDIDFSERRAVPVHFRSKIDPKIQSDDIASMLMMNILTTENYRQKTDLEPTLYIVSEATSKKKVGVTTGISKILKISSSDLTRQLEIEGKDSNEYKALQSTLNVRMYGRHLKEIGDIPFLGSGEKAVQNIERATSDLLLGFNYMANTVNIFQGKTQQIIEAISDGNFKASDFANAEGDFLKDFKDIITDFGTIDKESSTWQMIETLNLFGETGLSTRFSEESWAKKLMSRDTLHIGMSAGEIYIHGTLAYMILRGHKGMNNKRQWINKDGKVVKDKKDAASLRDLMYFEDGQMKFKHAVYSTISNFRIDSLEGVNAISSKIKNLGADLFGQYNPEMKSMAQTYWWGRLGFALRKWMVRGFNRRWRGLYTMSKTEDRSIDRKFNEASQEFEEGMYTTMLKWLRLIVRSTDNLANLVSLHAASGRVWKSLTNNEKRNVIRAAMEMGLAALSMGIYWAAKEAAEDDDDEFLYHLAYAHRRLYSEMMFFLSPPEAMKILRSPFAAMSTFNRYGMVMSQAFEDLIGLEFEKYETGVRKGEYKLFEKMKNATPVLNYIDDPWRIEEKLRYMSGIRSF